MGLYGVLGSSTPEVSSDWRPSPHARTARSAAWAATVTYVVDGDSIWVRSTERGSRVKLRLLGIDAPEICQDQGREARAALRQWALNRPVRVTVRARDQYGRALATVDVASGEAATAIHQRSDVCAVPAAGVVAEAMVALVLAEACLEKFGGDSVAETARNHRAYLAAIPELMRSSSEWE